VRRAAVWIARKRVADGDGPHAGLLPAGFSAEHLGPNDFYYWDDYWSLAGLRAAAALERGWGDERSALRWEEEESSLASAVERSLARAARRLGRPAMPASPSRRLDSGAIGSLAAGYPLQLYATADPRLLDTAAFLHQACLVGGGFFQDVIHSGVNPYLTLHLAQVFLRAGDPRFAGLVRTVAALASATGQWPEAVHPRTGGGCMGDGHHAWAAAEWVMAVRNAFVREEGGGLVLAAGVLPEWVGEERARFGPAPTPWGPVTVEVVPAGEGWRVLWQGQWRGAPPPVVVPAAAGGSHLAHGGAAGEAYVPRPAAALAEAPR
jgi:hypothetical protein